MDDIPGKGSERPIKSELNLSQSVPNADIISLESVINVLVKKGICTPEELFEEELQRKQYQDKVKNIPLVSTKTSRSHGESSYRRRNQNWLKRKMAKRRWTRKLGTALFGWKWKKVKVENTNRHITE